MGSCKNCSNREICTKNDVKNCDRYDVAFTRSEIINMFMSSDATKRSSLKGAVERAYGVKMAF
jgi:hypothetical protein